MALHAEHAPKPERTERTDAAAAGFAGAASLTALHRTAVTLNAGPAVAAQRAVAAMLSSGDRAAPVQRYARMLQQSPGPAQAVAQRVGIFSGIFKMFKRMPADILAHTEIMAPKTFKYRVDMRPPQDISKMGFKPKKEPKDQITMKDIQNYQFSNVNNPGVISTADTRDAALTFAHQLGKTSPGMKYIYRVDLGGLVHFPLHKNVPWWQQIFYSEQQETIVQGGITPDRISLVESIETSGDDGPQDFKD